ncbi:MAG: flavodoxin family protein, partial [Clostridia bacterium]|nr:flavodoxin family protein [Clostridia bacterium]
EVIAFLDRLFWNYGKEMAYKPGAAIVSARRSGTTASFDVLNKYFTITQMPVVSSQYWNMVHGNTPDEVRQDGEGLQTMRTLARNMAWLLKSIQAGKEHGVALPESEERIGTNFIR